MMIFAPLVGDIWRTLEAYGIYPDRVINAEVYKPSEAYRIDERVSYSTYNEILTRAVGLIEPCLYS